jgi:hypothetical protein
MLCARFPARFVATVRPPMTARTNPETPELADQPPAGRFALSASRLSIAAGYRSPRRPCSAGCAVAGGAMSQSMPGW